MLKNVKFKKNNENFNLTTIKPGFVDTKMTKNIKLNKFLTNKPEDIAKIVYNYYKNNIKVGVPLRWKIIMSALKLIPDFIFKKLKI